MGDKIGPYAITGELGRGAMAVVWRALDPKLQRVVALKEPLIPAGLNDTEAAQYRALFVREGCIAARLNHPNIVSIFAADEYDGRPIIAMELLEGATLDRVIRSGRPTLQTTFKVIEQTLEAVAYAHEQGVVHRDIKPQNLFVTTSGVVKLTDFGIARFPSGTMSLTPMAFNGTIAVQGSVLGTPGYMSPEQVRGDQVDARTDLFAIGVVAHEMLSGANPFGSLTGTALTTIMYRIANVEVPSVSSLDPTVPREMSDAIDAALRKNVDERVASARELLELWHRAADAVGVLPREQGIVLDLMPESPPTLLDMPPLPTELDIATVPPLAVSPAEAETLVLERAPVTAPTPATERPVPQAPAAPMPPAGPTAAAPEPVATIAASTVATLPVRLPQFGSPHRSRTLAAIGLIAVIVVLAGSALALGLGLRRPTVSSTARDVTVPASSTAPAASIVATPTRGAVKMGLRTKNATIYSGGSAALVGSIADTSGVALFGATVKLARNVRGTWKTLGTYTTKSTSFSMAVKPTATTSYMLTFAGDDTHESGKSHMMKIVVKTRPRTITRHRTTATKSKPRTKTTIPPWGAATPN
jgi:serine/threonine protein kinase